MTKQSMHYSFLILAVAISTLCVCKSAQQSIMTDKEEVNLEYNYPSPEVYTEKRPFCNAFAGNWFYFYFPLFICSYNWKNLLMFAWIWVTCSFIFLFSGCGRKRAGVINEGKNLFEKVFNVYPRLLNNDDNLINQLYAKRFKEN